MKTLTKNGLSIYLFDDAEVLSITEENITVGDPPKFIVGDCNSSDTTLFTDVTPPEDWTGCKYFYGGAIWSLNPDWVEPESDEDVKP